MPAEAAPGTVSRLAARGRRLDIEIEGGRVCWRGWGRADAAQPPLLLLHGGHGSWLHWARNIDALSAQRMLWVADMPGYGDSDAVPDGSLVALVDRLAASAAGLPGVGGRVVDLAGFSFGGLVAAHLAAHLAAKSARPLHVPAPGAPRVRALALLGPAGHGGARRPRGALQDWKPAARDGDAEALAAAMRHNLRMHMLHADAAVDADAVFIHTQACLRARFLSKRISRAGGLADALAAHTGTLLLIWGAEDVTAVPTEAAAALAAARAGCRVDIIPGAGHWVQYEAADAVNALLQVGLDGLELRQPFLPSS